jgi:hypothetical protein
MDRFTVGYFVESTKTLLAFKRWRLRTVSPVVAPIRRPFRVPRVSSRSCHSPSRADPPDGVSSSPKSSNPAPTARMRNDRRPSNVGSQSPAASEVEIDTGQERH